MQCLEETQGIFNPDLTGILVSQHTRVALKVHAFQTTWQKIPEEKGNNNFLWLLGGFQLSPATLLWVGSTGCRACVGFITHRERGRSTVPAAPGRTRGPGFANAHHPCWARFPRALRWWCFTSANACENLILSSSGHWKPVLKAVRNRTV